MLLESITVNPSAPNVHPISSSVSGHVTPSWPRTSGPDAPSSADSTAAATPSANRAVEITLATEASRRLNVRLHSSATISSTGRPPPVSRARSAACASPTAPPAQPRPNIDSRCVWRAGRPRRASSRASSDGVARPVVDTKTSPPTSAGSTPAASRAARPACWERSVAHC